MSRKSNITDVLSLALPAVLEMVFNMMIWVFDTMMVGKYGGNVAVSTVGLSSEIMYTFTNIFISIGVSVAIASLAARRFGAKEYATAEEYAALGVTLGAVIALIISLGTFIYCHSILKLAGASSEVLQQGVVYMRIVSIGIFFSMLTNLFNAVFRAYGNTKTPLLIAILLNIVHLGLDWVLIFGRLGFPELGIKGAAIATASAQIFGFIYAAFYMAKYSKLKVRLNYFVNFKLHRLVDVMKLAIPSSLQEGAFSMSRLINTFMIMHIGTIAFASNQITTTIESVSFMPGWGFAVAATTLVGHKVGEKNFKKARDYAHTCTILGVVVMGACGLSFLLMPKLLISWFISSEEAEVIRLGALCLMVASIEQPFMAMSMIYGGALKGAGDTKTPFLVSLFTSWFIRMPLMFYFIYILKVSVVYVWWITAIQWAIDGPLVYLFFKRRFRNINSENSNNENINPVEA